MPSKEPVQNSVALDFERRAQQMKDKLTGEVSPTCLCDVRCKKSLSPMHSSNSYFLLHCLNSCLLVFLCRQDTPEVLNRETWMTELPPELQHIGLGARTFKKRSGPENKDRSIWTDTPADRERKARVMTIMYLCMCLMIPIKNALTYTLFPCISWLFSWTIGTPWGKEERWGGERWCLTTLPEGLGNGRESHQA